MATANFYLKTQNKNGKCPIIFVYQSKGSKFKFFTKLSIEKENWNGKRIKGDSLEVRENNKRLKEYEDFIDEIEIEALRNRKIYTIDTISQKFRLRIAIESKGSEFEALFSKFIEDSRVTKTANTIKGYYTTFNNLREFSEFKKVILSFENFNNSFYNRFVSYLITDKGQLNNSVGKNIKNFKVFLNYVISNELINVPLNITGFKVYKEDIDIIALSEEELWKIYYLEDLSNSLEYVRDNFCFQCFTGLRFSDIVKLKNEHIKEKFIEFRTQKTKDSLYIPLNTYAIQILNKYKGKFEGRPLPPVFANQQCNKKLKLIADLAGVIDILVIEKFSGSNRIVIKKPKSEFISTHTGRKTFITLSHERGMPIEMIMKITGISNWATLKKYLKVSEKAKLIQMNEFWKENKLVIGN